MSGAQWGHDFPRLLRTCQSAHLCTSADHVTSDQLTPALASCCHFFKQERSRQPLITWKRWCWRRTSFDVNFLLFSPVIKNVSQSVRWDVAGVSSRLSMTSLCRTGATRRSRSGNRSRSAESPFDTESLCRIGGTEVERRGHFEGPWRTFSRKTKANYSWSPMTSDTNSSIEIILYLRCPNLDLLFYHLPDENRMLNKNNNIRIALKCLSSNINSHPLS